jgi:hypothetical protein
VVGASKERVPAVRERLRQDGIDVCGHCDRPRDFCPPRDAQVVLLITDMGNHAALQKAREYCRARGLPCVGGLWRTWSTTRQRLSALAAAGGCAPRCPLRPRCRAGDA